MNKKLLWALVGALVIGGGAFAYLKYFGASEKHLAIVPIDASFVMGFDVKSLADKMELNGDFKNTKLFKYIEKQRKESNNEDVEGKLISEILNDPLGSGISLGSKVYFFMYSKGNAKYMGVTFGLADEDKFVNTCKKIGLKGALKKTKNMNYYSSSEHSIMSWNSKGLSVITSMNFYSGESETPLVNVVDEIMGQDDSKSIAASTYYKKSNHKDKDISFFMNYGRYMDDFANIGMGNPAVSGMSKLFKGVFMDAGINFENNRIHLDGELIGDKEALEKMNATMDNGLSENALKCIAAGNVLAFISGKLDVEKSINLYDEMLKPNVEVRKSLKSYAEMNGIKYEDLLKTFSGDFSLSLAGFETKMVSQPSYEMNEATGQFEIIQKESRMVLPKIAIAIGVNNKSIVEKMLANTQIPAENDMRIMPFPVVSGMNIYMVSKNNVLFLTNDETMGRSVQSQGFLGDMMDKELKGLAKDNSGAFYMNLDINQYSAMFEDKMQSENDKKMYNQVKSYMSIFKDLRGYSKKGSTELNINLAEGKGNSLFRLLKQADVFDFE